MPTSRPGAGDGTATGTGGRGALERVTVNLTPRAVRALDQVVALTGDTKTDTINRALQVYAYLEQIMRADGAIYVRPTPNAEPERLRIF